MDDLARAPFWAFRQRVSAARGWFSSIAIQRDGSIIDHKTGRRVTAAQISPAELAKFISYFVVVLVESAWRAVHSQRRPKVCFLPDSPPPWYVLWSAAKLSGACIVDDPTHADALFYFEDATTGMAPLTGGRPLINGAVLDISKSRVAKAFESVSGYPLLLDPRTHEGLAVEKSEINGSHDGRIVHCPCAPLPGKCYQRFVDCGDGEIAIDYRVTIIARRARFVVIKTKCATARFSVHNDSAVYAEVADVFSSDEVELLERFASALRLDWAAIDVLRDRRDGQIYVVDVNKTDTGPAVDLSRQDRKRVKSALVIGFRELLEVSSSA
jgi:hypothetical protein